MRTLILIVAMLLPLLGMAESHQTECRWWDGSKEWICTVDGKQVSPIWHIQADRRIKLEAANSGYVMKDKVLTIEDVQAGQIATCNLEYRDCAIIEPSAFPCYQRMREAMRSADKYLDGQWNEAWREYDKWKQVMKDCVEDQ